MGNTSKLCISEWKKDMNHRDYRKVIVESSTIAMLYYRENDEEWIEKLEMFKEGVENMSTRQIAPHVKNYITDFIEKEISVIQGKITKNKLMKERLKTLELISKAYKS